MSTALSLFGDSYEPADPPATDRCPACGGPSPKGRTCSRCKRAGIEAARLDLAPATSTPSPIPADWGNAKPCPECETVSPEWTDHCPACGYRYVTENAAPALTPTQEHRARCDGPLMAPVFGIGRTSCLVCDWSPSDG